MSEKVVYLALGAVVVGFLALLLALGPVGWVAAVVLLASVFWLAEQSGLLSNEAATQKVNCRACGARNPTTRETCHYCGERIGAE